MSLEIINEIKIKMEDSISSEQMKKLEHVLAEVLYSIPPCSIKKKNRENLIKQFISAKRIEGISEKTERYYSSVLYYFETKIKKELCTVSTEEIRDYLIVYQKDRNCTNLTLDNMRRILSSFYKWLEEEDFIIKSPMIRIHKIKIPVKIKSALTDEQIEMIRKKASFSKRNLAIVDFLLSSGIRVSELNKLNRNSIDLENRSCLVFGKGAKQRETYFDVRTKVEIENYLKERKDKNKALFVTERKYNKGSCKRLSINAIEKIVRDIGKRAEISNVHPHRFRRTLATRAIDKGMPIEQVQVLLGHTKIDTTLKYAKVLQANVKFGHQKYLC